MENLYIKKTSALISFFPQPQDCMQYGLLARCAKLLYAFGVSRSTNGPA